MQREHLPLSLCSCSESPCLLTRCSVCWCFMARWPPLDTLQEEWSLDVPSPPIWSNCTACLCWTKSCDSTLESRLTFSLTTRTSRRKAHHVKPGNSSALRGELSPMKLRNTSVSTLQKRKQPLSSSHRKLALSVARHLGLQAESVKTQTVGLGVDVGAGKARTATAAKRRKSQAPSIDEASRNRSPESLLVRHAPCSHVWLRALRCLRRRVEETAALGIGGSQPADSRQISVCPLALVRRPNDTLAHCTHPEMGQGGLALSHASAT